MKSTDQTPPSNHPEPDAAVCVRVVAVGEHAWFDQQMAVRHVTPVIHEVLLVNSEEQAEQRCLGISMNRGKEAAQTAVNMMALFRKMRASFAGQPTLEDA